jgi:arylsulfatase A
VPTLLGKGAQAEHEYLYWLFEEQGGREAVLKDGWKAVRLNTRENPDGPIELYNLKNDIGEKNNVADENPDRVKELSALIEEARN